MILVKVTAEKDGIPVEYTFEAEPDTAINESMSLIEALKEQGFKAPSKPSYGGKKGGKPQVHTIDYNSENKLLSINVAYIPNETERNTFNEGFKAAFKAATKRYIWFNMDEKQWQYPPPNNADAKPLNGLEILAIDNSEFFKVFERGEGFKKAVADIKDFLEKSKKEKVNEGNPF